MKLEKIEHNRKPKQELMENSKGLGLDHNVIGETKLNSFNRIIDRIIQKYELNNHELPTFYYATKHRERTETDIMEIFGEFFQLKDAWKSKIVKDKGALSATHANAPKKEKIEKIFYAEIEWRMDEHNDLMLKKLDHLDRNEWVVTEEDRKMLILIAVYGARNQVTT